MTAPSTERFTLIKTPKPSRSTLSPRRRRGAHHRTQDAALSPLLRPTYSALEAIATCPNIISPALSAKSSSLTPPL